MICCVRSRATPLALAAFLALAACGESKPPPALPPANVATITAQAATVPVINELPGRLSPTRVAQVRARVPGIVLERLFVEGSEVKAGQVLFRIDPAPLRAAHDSARAALERAQADAFQASALVRRYEPLAAAEAVSKQEYDNAAAAAKQAQAQVAAARAELERARINLDYATVTAPISGRIGRAMVTEGALVGQGDATPLATVQQIDPIYADFTQAAADFLRLRRAAGGGRIGQIERDAAQVRLVLEDGSEYPLAGKLLFADISVDESTGQVGLRGAFPNPGRLLLPGTYVRVRLQQGTALDAITVPQQAVQRDSGGRAFVMVVEPARDDKGEPKKDAQGNPALVAQQRVVDLGNTLGERWIVTSGLKPGDEVIVEGFQRAAPGAPVVARPWESPAARKSGR